MIACGVGSFAFVTAIQPPSPLFFTIAITPDTLVAAIYRVRQGVLRSVAAGFIEGGDVVWVDESLHEPGPSDATLERIITAGDGAEATDNVAGGQGMDPVRGGFDSDIVI